MIVKNGHEGNKVLSPAAIVHGQDVSICSVVNHRLIDASPTGGSMWRQVAAIKSPPIAVDISDLWPHWTCTADVSARLWVIVFIQLLTLFAN